MINEESYYNFKCHAAALMLQKHTLDPTVWSELCILKTFFGSEQGLLSDLTTVVVIIPGL